MPRRKKGAAARELYTWYLRLNEEEQVRFCALLMNDQTSQVHLFLRGHFNDRLGGLGKLNQRDGELEQAQDSIRELKGLFE
jgi:hypothetical protein